jgi:hypothetical protein
MNLILILRYRKVISGPENKDTLSDTTRYVKLYSTDMLKIPYWFRVKIKHENCLKESIGENELFSL